MKTNEILERIYISLRPSISEGYVYTTVSKDFPNAVEYTKTDAFIEKACSWLKENKDKYLYNTGESGEYIPTCSTKMIEEFAKYMEGE